MLSAPNVCDVFEALRFADDVDGEEGDVECRARVGDGEQFGSDRCDCDTEFLGQFARGGVGVGFTSFDLAAGEFEEGAVAFVVRALTDEEAVTPCDNGSDDSNSGFGHSHEHRMRDVL